jgi:5,10-methylenetetrahydromethanopterin reductase
MRASVLYPLLPRGGEELVGWARLVRDGAADRLWLGQCWHAAAQHVFAWLAGRGLAGPTGTAVALTPLRHPVQAALEARSVALLTGAPHVLGIGQGSPAFARALGAEPGPGALREQLAVARAVLAGERLTYSGEHVTAKVTVPPLGHPPVELAAGVLRAGAARVAGELADAAISWLAPPAYLDGVLGPALRSAGRAPRLVAVVHIGVAGPGRDPVALAARAHAGHLTQPHYRAMLAAAGVPLPGPDPLAAGRTALAAGVHLHGEPAEVADRLADWAAAGVDEVVLNASGTAFTEGPDAALADVTAVLGALRTRRRP